MRRRLTLLATEEDRQDDRQHNAEDDRGHNWDEDGGVTAPDHKITGEPPEPIQQRQPVRQHQHYAKNGQADPGEEQQAADRDKVWHNRPCLALNLVVDTRRDAKDDHEQRRDEPDDDRQRQQHDHRTKQTLKEFHLETLLNDEQPDRRRATCLAQGSIPA